MTTTIIYCPCYAVDDLILCLEDKQKVALSQHVLFKNDYMFYYFHNSPNSVRCKKTIKNDFNVSSSDLVINICFAMHHLRCIQIRAVAVHRFDGIPLFKT